MADELGYDLTTLRPTLDLDAANRRLLELQQLRSLPALMERASLLESLGRLDEAAATATRAVANARASGSRELAAEARLLRASVAIALGETSTAIVTITSVIEESRSADWVELWAAALHLRGIANFTVEQWLPAVEDFERALALRRDAELGRTAIEASELALLVARDRFETEARPHTNRAHPLFGRRAH